MPAQSFQAGLVHRTCHHLQNRWANQKQIERLLPSCLPHTPSGYLETLQFEIWAQHQDQQLQSTFLKLHDLQGHNHHANEPLKKHETADQLVFEVGNYSLDLHYPMPLLVVQ